MCFEKIWSFRSDSKIPLSFTLDAGANVHVLYPENEKDAVVTFIKNELAVFCQNEHFISDQIGFGAERLT